MPVPALMPAATWVRPLPVGDMLHTRAPAVGNGNDVRLLTYRLPSGPRAMPVTTECVGADRSRMRVTREPAGAAGSTICTRSLLPSVTYRRLPIEIMSYELLSSSVNSSWLFCCG